MRGGGCGGVIRGGGGGVIRGGGGGREGEGVGLHARLYHHQQVQEYWHNRERTILVFYFRRKIHLNKINASYDCK